MPMHHRGEHVGNFNLAEKDNGAAFTNDDEEILALFASQAAATIANARTYEAERRARTDLEALVETSPVGVVVFDVTSGAPLTFNREGRRIVETLRQPGRPVEDLLQIMTFRRADGSEVSLAESSFTSLLSNAETVRSEEVILSTPDGQSVAMLINATANVGEDGTTDSVVVTMQDLAPIEELKRTRTEFVEMVSHGIRFAQRTCVECRQGPDL